MNIFYATDENYCAHTGVSIVSLLENNRMQNHITIYILEFGISRKSHARLMSIQSRYDNASFITISGDHFLEELQSTNLFLPEYCGNITAAFILFIGVLLPQTVQKVLCLDSDTLILGSLTPLMSTNMNNRVLAAVPDWGTNAMHYQILDQKYTSCQSKTYFNSGVVLFNLELLRKQNLTDYFASLIRKHKDIWILPDQDILNYSIPAQYVKNLPLRYNYWSGVPLFLYWFRAKRIARYSFSTFYKEYKQATIMHFIAYPNGTKAWDQSDSKRTKKLYLKYRNISPWKNVPLTKNKNACHGMRLIAQYFYYFADFCPFEGIRSFLFKIWAILIKLKYRKTLTKKESHPL